MTANAPRIVFVTRESDYELLIAKRATRAQASFFLEKRAMTRGGQQVQALAAQAKQEGNRQIEELEARHERIEAVLHAARAALPDDCRQTSVPRREIDRFLFGPEDIVVAVGQDGLIANVAKYLSGQPVLGINPLPDLYDGVLARLPPERASEAIAACIAGRAPVERRTMVEARLDQGERLLALNEIFVGHRSHQSARYRLALDGAEEAHSSSGLIVASGTGATGWARSIMEATREPVPLKPEEDAVALFVREPFPSRATETGIRAAKIATAPLTVTSQMNEGGTIFADGIEQDFIAFDWGRTVTIGPAREKLHLVTG